MLDIIIPAKGENHRIQFAIASIKSGVEASGFVWGQDVHCIIVDDTDEEKFGHQTYQDNLQDPAIVVISRKPEDTNTSLNVCSAREHGAAVSKAEYVLFFDAHIIPSHNFWLCVGRHLKNTQFIDQGILHFPLQPWDWSANHVLTHYNLDLDWDFWGRDAIVQDMRDSQYPTGVISIPSWTANAMLTKRKNFLDISCFSPDMQGYVAGADETVFDLMAWMKGYAVYLEARGWVMVHEVGHEYADDYNDYNRNILSGVYHLGGEAWAEIVLENLVKQGRLKSSDRDQIAREAQNMYRQIKHKSSFRFSLDNVLSNKPWERINDDLGFGTFNNLFQYLFSTKERAEKYGGTKRPDDHGPFFY